MPPALLAVMKMQCLEGLLHRLMASKASPLMVPSIGTELSLGEVGSGLMQPVSCTIHGVILSSCPQSVSPYSSSRAITSLTCRAWAAECSSW